uniref:Uncharacterized protein n=1 Tax=Leersia perrieri TaxID=77586 RepID=A0A0D9VW47_9ORYZ
MPQLMALEVVARRDASFWPATGTTGERSLHTGKRGLCIPKNGPYEVHDLGVLGEGRGGDGGAGEEEARGAGEEGRPGEWWGEEEGEDEDKEKRESPENEEMLQPLPLIWLGLIFASGRYNGPLATLILASYQACDPGFYPYTATEDFPEGMEEGARRRIADAVESIMVGFDGTLAAFQLAYREDPPAEDNAEDSPNDPPAA